MGNSCFRCIIALFLISSLSYAQNEKGCGFNYAQDKLRKAYPDYDARLKQFERMEFGTANKSAAATVTIPVVFHVLHLNGSENISDAQIQSAIDVLNIDFRKLNSDTTSIVVQFKNLAADVNVQFKLASLDPDGKCTNGITRHYDSKTNWDVDQDYYTYTWPREKYLNIYVVKSMTSNAAAYTFLPGTAPPVMDAIVSLDDYVGKIGTSSTGRSRTLTHEVGHWLGLPHIWGSTNNPGVSCGDDGVSDTPITKGHSWCNLANAIDCTPTVVENLQNYMEYSGCPRMFTIGQSTKMNGVLTGFSERINLVSASNMTATGIVNPNYNCAPKAEFLITSKSTCEGNQVTFTDHSYNGTVSSWLWSSIGASNTSTLQNGLLTFTSSGLMPVKLKVGNSFGSDSTTKINFIAVMANNGSTLNVAQDFEIGSYPNNQWIATPPQFGSGFAQTSTVGASGQKCLYVNNYGDNPNGKVELFSPKFDLTNVTGAQLSFKYAYSQKGNSADDLTVFISTNCGQSWSTIYGQVGSGLATTAAPTNTTAFIPMSNQFKTELINIGSYQGNSSVHFKFAFTPDAGGPGNNFFIDDINLTGTVGLKEIGLSSNDIKLYPNPANTLVNLFCSVDIKQVDVFDLLGKQIESIQGSNSNEQIIEVSQLAKGVYFIKVTSNSGSAFKKLVIE